MSTGQTGPASPSGGVRPDPAASSLVNEMLAMEDVMYEILDETIPSERGAKVHESGRTLCGRSSEVYGPLARFPTAVELESCPRGTRGGTWHTHVTKDQLRSPNNSLPDTANVVFGDIDVSVVAGTREAEAVVAAEDLEAAQQVFRDALGADVESTEGVVSAIIGGDVPDPTDARHRVRSRMSSLFSTHPTNFTDMDRRLDKSGIEASSPISFELVDARQHAMIAQELRLNHTHRKNPVRDPESMRQHIRSRNTAAKKSAGKVNVREAVVGSAIGAVVSRAMGSVF